MVLDILEFPPRLEAQFRSTLSDWQRLPTVWYDVVRFNSWIIETSKYFRTVGPLQLLVFAITSIILLLEIAAQSLFYRTTPWLWRIRLSVAVNVVNIIYMLIMQHHISSLPISISVWGMAFMALSGTGLPWLALSAITAGQPCSWRRIQLVIMTSLLLADAPHMCETNISLNLIYLRLHEIPARLFNFPTSDGNQDVSLASAKVLGWLPTDQEIMTCTAWQSAVLILGYLFTSFLCYFGEIRARKAFLSRHYGPRNIHQMYTTVSSYLQQEVLFLVVFISLAVTTVTSALGK